MYGGVTVQHLKPNSAPTRDGMTRREKRTLWLMLLEVGSLRLGLVSKVKDNGIDTNMDDVTVASSAASSRADADVSILFSVHCTHCPLLSQPIVVLKTSAVVSGFNCASWHIKY